MKDSLESSSMNHEYIGKKKDKEIVRQADWKLSNTNSYKSIYLSM